ncbi:hypothetical protein JYU34_021332 [Plutella xylostella]|uniref:Thyroglobulin type-1 domain-containing protein n=1 Tax=Plutella xylostella TaxID=51655 RepID=A0ABQ7PTE5_PLUXY|nr:hypothetical protein JYU34_021332 [Plutella xylostella]
MRWYSFGVAFVLVVCGDVCAGAGDSQCEVAAVCVTDLTDEDCGAGYKMMPNSNIFNCCPRCVLDTEPDPETPCPATANCLPDGTYAPVQCKGDNFLGRCFCTNAEGKRIFGQMWRNDADKMTCACSRKRADLEAAGRTDVTLHCTAQGDYEPLQCDDGVCWCAEPSTGQPTVAPVAEADMTRLPCYSKTQMGESYLRKCESVVHALAVIQREQIEHGTNFLGNPVTFCDYDGSFGPVQIRNNIAYCTNREGDIVGSWGTPQSEMTGMNCNCALDTTVHYPAAGLSVSQSCLPNGNYDPKQQAGEQRYCVDSDGYQASPYAATWPDDCIDYA